MNQVATIRLVKGSKKSKLCIEDVELLLSQYFELVSKTGKQLGWDYSAAAFPYTMEKTAETDKYWVYLKGTNELYKHLVVLIDHSQNERMSQLQIILPHDGTHGDKAKANELGKFMAKQWKAELHLFNGRVMHYQHIK